MFCTDSNSIEHYPANAQEYSQNPPMLFTEKFLSALQSDVIAEQ
jgi:hypothetical protein